MRKRREHVNAKILCMKPQGKVGDCLPSVLDSLCMHTSCGLLSVYTHSSVSLSPSLPDE